MVITAGPLLRPRLLLRQPSDRFSRLPSGTRTFTATGRSAFLSCVRQLSVSDKSTVLLPAYLCPAVLEPFRKLGMKVVYYPLSRSLEPDLSFLKSATCDGSAGAVVIIHYFGFPVKKFEEIRSLCEERSVALIEDCAHALFSCYQGRPLGEWGDGAIFSFRKSLPLPEGGMAVVKNYSGHADENNLRLKPVEFKNLLKEWLFWFESIIGFSPRNYLLGHPCFRKWIESGNRMPDDICEERMGLLSYSLFKKMDPAKSVERRRENYELLFSRLNASRSITILSGELVEGVSPVGLPILVENRDKLRDYFYKKGFGLRAFWDLLPEDVLCFPDSVWLSERVLVLPVHEDLTQRELDTLANEFLKI